jgi:hypothetical protein
MRIAFSLVGVVTLAGCMTRPIETTPAGGIERPPNYRDEDDAALRRFSADHGCPVEKVEHEAIGKGVHRLTGCGARGFYRCEGYGEPVCRREPGTDAR